MSDEIERKRKESEAWYWWGIPTFFRCPWNVDPNACDIGLVGVPHSTGNGSTERDQHLGPRAVRHVSGYYRRAHGVHNFSPFETVTCHDLGDVPLPEANNNEACVRDIEEFYKTLDAAGTFPVSVGGDHAITGPILKAIAGAGSRISNGEKCALVHFDAHTDSYENMEHWLGARKSAAHWAAYTVREGAVDAVASSQLAIRGHPSAKIHTETVGGKSTELGYRVIPMQEIDDIGVEETIRIVRDRAGDKPVYVTFDLDALDPSVAPGVANIEPGFGGLSIRQATKLLQGLKGLNVIGGDVVCLMPTKDNPNQITAQVAMVVAFEILSLIAYRMKQD